MWGKALGTFCKKPRLPAMVGNCGGGVWHAVGSSQYCLWRRLCLVFFGFAHGILLVLSPEIAFSIALSMAEPEIMQTGPLSSVNGVVATIGGTVEAVGARAAAVAATAVAVGLGPITVSHKMNR